MQCHSRAYWRSVGKARSSFINARRRTWEARTAVSCSSVTLRGRLTGLNRHPVRTGFHSHLLPRGSYSAILHRRHSRNRSHHDLCQSARKRAADCNHTLHCLPSSRIRPLRSIPNRRHGSELLQSRSCEWLPCSSSLHCTCCLIFVHRNHRPVRAALNVPDARTRRLARGVDLRKGRDRLIEILSRLALDIGHGILHIE